MRRALPAGVVLSCLLASAAVSAEGNEQLFGSAVAALQRGATDEAIDRLELLADRGVVHPDASYDRGLAYARRATSRSARAGDLGRAAAAFSEALLARPEDRDAALALAAVKGEIARRRGRLGVTVEEPRSSLGWAIVALLPENTWSALSVFASAVTTLGLALVLFATGRRRRIAGATAAAVAGPLLLLTSLLAALARHERTSHRAAVVVTSEARLLDEAGRSISGPGSVVPEGATLRVLGTEGALARVSWGTLEGRMSLGQLRLLPVHAPE